MKKLSVSLVGTCLLLAGIVPAVAQKMSDNPPPPNVLVVQREMLKPGKAGSPHMKTESAFVQAMTDAKSESYYLGMDSLSGPTRALFFLGYDSIAAWQKDQSMMQTNAAFGAAMDSAMINDGELLSEYNQTVLLYQKNMSYNDHINVGDVRYWEIHGFKVKPGHEADWAAMVKLYLDYYAKAAPGSQWATFQSAYGVDNGGMYFIFIPYKSAAEIDTSFSNDSKFFAALGKEGQKKLADLSAAAIDSTQTNLFAVNPKLSYVAPAWSKTDPSFWNAK